MCKCVFIYVILQTLIWCDAFILFVHAYFGVLCVLTKSCTFAAEMKQWWLNSIAIVLIICFVWAGAGVNAVRYCCAECRQAGIGHILDRSCDQVHHHTPFHSQDCCHHGDGCTFTRLQVSEGGISHTIQVPEATTLDVPAFPAIEQEILLLATAKVEKYNQNTRQTIPITGRIVSISDRSILI